MTRHKSDLPIWCRLSAGLQHDEDFCDLSSTDAMAVFLLGIPIAKERRRDGEIDLRDFLKPLHGKLDMTALEMIAMELVTAGFWLHAGGLKYIVRSYTRWNESNEEQAVAKEQKRLGAMRTNHKRGRHPSPVAGCPDCELAVSPAQPADTSEDVAIATAGATAGANASTSLDERRETRDERRNTNTSSSEPERSNLKVPLVDDERRRSDLDLARQLCEEFVEHRRRLSPDSKPLRITKAWVADMDRMLRLDGPPAEDGTLTPLAPERIRAAMAWLETSDGAFWANQIRSVPKLRAELPRLRDEAKRRAAVREDRQQAHQPASDWQAAHAVATGAYREAARTGVPMADLLEGQPERLIHAALQTRAAWKSRSETDAKFTFKAAWDAWASAPAAA